MLSLSQLPGNPCCYSTSQCCSPLRTSWARNRFPALVRSSVEPFLESRILVKNGKTLLFSAASAPPLVHQSMLPNYCPVCLRSESCQIRKPFLLSSWFAQNPILSVAVFIQQNEPHETNFLLPLSQLPENPCCYITGQCCSPLRTARTMNRFPALVRSSVEPFFGISNFGQKRQNAPFLDRCCSVTGAPIHAALLLPSLYSY